MADSEKRLCLCRKTWEEDPSDMVKCDMCHEWIHLKCIGIKDLPTNINGNPMVFKDQFQCPLCNVDSDHDNAHTEKNTECTLQGIDESIPQSTQQIDVNKTKDDTLECRTQPIDNTDDTDNTQHIDVDIINNGLMDVSNDTDDSENKAISITNALNLIPKYTHFSEKRKTFSNNQTSVLQQTITNTRTIPVIAKDSITNDCNTNNNASRDKRNRKSRNRDKERRYDSYELDTHNTNNRKRLRRFSKHRNRSRSRSRDRDRKYRRNTYRDRDREYREYRDRDRIYRHEKEKIEQYYKEKVLSLQQEVHSLQTENDCKDKMILELQRKNDTLNGELKHVLETKQKKRKHKSHKHKHGISLHSMYSDSQSLDNIGSFLVMDTPVVMPTRYCSFLVMDTFQVLGVVNIYLKAHDLIDII